MQEEIKTNHDTEEYITFHITARDGRDVEMAIVDEFKYKKKTYIVSAVVEDDKISEECQYIYRYLLTGDDFKVEEIHNRFEYEEVVKAYMNMEE